MELQALSSDAVNRSFSGKKQRHSPVFLRFSPCFVFFGLTK
ncbi:hypothetical protein GA8_13655 [Geobacillus sp. A8]|nr:hypothetical protein GA8_13655 [Geobacillus sp. A8]